MTVYYWRDDVPAHGRVFCKGQIAKFTGMVIFGQVSDPGGKLATVVCMQQIDENLHACRNVVRRSALVLDEDVTPPRIVRNDFGPWFRRFGKRIDEELDVDSFWQFWRLDGFALPEFVTTETGEIIRVSDGETIMQAPAPEGKR